MTEIEKEFFREGVPHGNHSWMTLVFDPELGELKVKKYRTSSRGTVTETEQMPLAVYLASGKATRARRALKARLHRISLAVSAG